MHIHTHVCLYPLLLLLLLTTCQVNLLDPTAFNDMGTDDCADKGQAFACQLATLIKALGDAGYHGAASASDPVLVEASEKVYWQRL